MCEPGWGAPSRKRMERTLIIVRRTLTVPKTALAGVTLETSFARFRASMAIFSEERAPPCPLGRWESVAMVEIPGRYEDAMRREGCEEEPEP